MNEPPIAIIGAGPVGLAAAARLVERGLRPAIFEKGGRVGASILEWGHVRVFSPWTYNVDVAARALLQAVGVTAPSGGYLPTGEEIVTHYLEPLASVPAIAGALHLGAEVTGVTKLGHDLMSNDHRAEAPFVIRYRDDKGEQRMLARAVIDASGTWSRPNPMGADGLMVPGELEAAELIAYGIPDVDGAERSSYAGKRTLVLGSGHSAINVSLALLDVQRKVPGTQVIWALRRDRIGRLLGGGLNDQLPGRGALGLAAKKAIDEGRLNMLAPFVVDRVIRIGNGLRIDATLAGQPVIEEVDRVVVATGFRPDFSFLRELRLGLDPAVEAPPALAPLIDPNIHSCGTVPPHGIDELTHPETGLTIVGSKSYGRAPTFLMATGYEQVRSVVAEIAGNHAAARQVHLVLPETGVCSAPAPDIAATPCCGAAPAKGKAQTECCGGPAPANVDACRADDAIAKSAGEEGCGCGADSASHGRLRSPMHGPETRAPASVIWALGVTQIVGYGTLYYSFAILAPDMAAEFGLPQQWAFGALSAALFLGSLLAPTVGRLADRFGAGRVMSWGSLAAALALAACGLAPERYSFAVALIAMELASCFVLYATAFVAIVQIGPAAAQRSITHLTLIAGFASTLFWPLTTFLHGFFDWRAIYLVFAAVHLLLCLPIHTWIARLAVQRSLAPVAANAGAIDAPVHPPLNSAGVRSIFLLMMAGFAIEGFVLSAVTLHFVPLLTALGLGAAGVAVSTLFGPAQVASRLINMVFGDRLRQSMLAVIAASLIAIGLATLLTTSPLVAGIGVFVVLFGLGSGLTSIVGGTLPLEVFGRATYGLHVGWMSAARQFSSAFAPFAFAIMMAGITVTGALLVVAAAAIAGIVVFASVALVTSSKDFASR